MPDMWHFTPINMVKKNPNNPNSELRDMGKLLMPIRYFRQGYYLFGDSEEKRKSILQGTGINVQMLEDSNAMISIDAQLQQIRNLRKLVGNDFTLKAKDVWRPASQGILDVALKSSPTIEEGLITLARYSWIRVPIIRTQQEINDNGLSFIIAPTLELPNEIWRSLSEIVLLSLQAMISKIFSEDALSSPLNSIEYFWPFPPPPYQTSLKEALIGKHNFYTDDCQIFLPKSLTLRASPFADETLLSVAIAKLEEDQQKIERQTTLSEQVRAILKFNDQQGMNTHKDANGVASALNMSTRTMVRRLASEGTTLRNLRDEILKNRAQVLIMTTKLSREEIASQLGYCDSASLSRSCRRWFGLSIRAMRKTEPELLRQRD